MVGVIIGSRKVGINPDNVATPIAASLGDLITLSLLAGLSSTLYEYIGEEIQQEHRWGHEGDEIDLFKILEATQIWILTFSPCKRKVWMSE